MDLAEVCIVLFGYLAATQSAKLSNSKLVPADGTICGPTKMGFKLVKSELIERFRHLASPVKDPVEVVQIYVAGTKPEGVCLYDPVLVEDKKLINVAVTEFEDGEKGINVTASPSMISLGNWLPYYTRDKAETCVSSVKADAIVYFQSDIVIEVVAPFDQAGARIKLTIQCEMPKPQLQSTDLKVHRVDHIGSAVGEIPFGELIQMKFVHPSDPSLAITEISLDDPVRLVIWKVRQEERSALRTSIIPIQCELYSDHTKSSGITFVQNSCQARTPADIITSVVSKRTDVEGLEFREVFWTDFKAFRFDGSGSLMASCTVRICAKSHLSDCHNRQAPNGKLCFEEANTQEMSDYPAITGEDGKPPEQPNPELELLRVAYPRQRLLPLIGRRYQRSTSAEEDEYVTIKQRLHVVSDASIPAELQAAAQKDSVTGITAVVASQTEDAGLRTAESCFPTFTVYVVLGVAGWLILFSAMVIFVLLCHMKRQRLKATDDASSLSSGETTLRTPMHFSHDSPHCFR